MGLDPEKVKKNTTKGVDPEKYEVLP